MPCIMAMRSRFGTCMSHDCTTFGKLYLSAQLTEQTGKATQSHGPHRCSHATFYPFIMTLRSLKWCRMFHVCTTSELNLPDLRLNLRKPSQVDKMVQMSQTHWSNRCSHPTSNGCAVK